MSYELFGSVSTLVSMVCVLCVMTDFRVRPTQAILIITVGSMMTFLFTLSAMGTFSEPYRSIGLLLAVIVPISFLFTALSKTRGFRYGYTLILALSITFLINTISILSGGLFGSLILGAVCGSCLLSVLCGYLFVRYRQRYLEVQRIKTTEWAGFSILPLLCLLLMIMISFGKVSAWFTMDHFDLKVILFAIIAITHLQIALNLQKFHQSQTLEKNNRILESMLIQMKQDLTDQIDKIRITKLHRHDLHHHLNLLSAAAHHPNLDEFDAHVRKLKQRLDETAIEAYCSHFTINAVLSVYFKKADTLKIKIRHQISLPEVLPVEDLDLSLILANAIENAINANQSLDINTRYLDLKLTHENKTLTLIIENPTNGSPTFKEGLPQSEDPDHGYGTMGIRSLAKRYRGSALFNIKKGRFILIVQMPL